MPDTLPSTTRLPLQLESSSGTSPAALEYTAVMPGFILDQRTLSDSSTVYVAYELHQSFPNLDLPGGDLRLRNGSDTVTLSFLARRLDDAGSPIFEGR